MWFNGKGWQEGKVINQICVGWGRKTNNQPEMYGLLQGLRIAEDKGIKYIIILGDSLITIQYVKYIIILGD